MVLPLHGDGKYLKDSSGYIVQLRGAHLRTGFEDNADGVWRNKAGNVAWGWNPTSVQDTLDGMVSWGMNFLTIQFAATYWINNASMKQHFRDIASWTNTRGLYVAFIMRQPGTADSPNMPFPSTEFPTATDFENFWGDMAADLKTYPNVLFGLYNEPRASSVRSAWYSAWQGCINAIRTENSENLIILEGEVSTYINMQYGNGDFITSWVNPYPFTDPKGNLIYSDHCYRYADIQKKTSPTRILAYTLEDLQLAFQMMGYNTVLDSGKPVMLGEYGCNMDVTEEHDPAGHDGEVAAALNTARVCNELGFHYAQWWFFNSSAGGVYRTMLNGANYPPNDGGNALITALGETAPRTLVVTPGDASFNVTDEDENLMSEPYFVITTQNLNVLAIPAEGYSFNNWLLDGVNAGSSNPLQVTMNANHTLTANMVLEGSGGVTDGQITRWLSMSDGDYGRAEKQSQRRARQMSYCVICGGKIVGKAFRVDEGKYACNRCNNERPGA